MRAWILAALAVLGCGDPDFTPTSFYDQRIDPVVRSGCALQTNGCHVASPEGEATGNLDLSSYDALARRDDLLHPYGPYQRPLFLLKGGPDIEVPVETWDPDPTTGVRIARVMTDIRHNAGQLLEEGSEGFAELKAWMDAGAERTNVPDETLVANLGDCVRSGGSYPAFLPFDPAMAPADAEGFQRFRDDVQPVLQESCAGSSCHGNEFADFYLTCGDTEEDLRWNYAVTLAHVSEGAPSTSGLLRRPLSLLRGGTFHEGGNVLGSTEDPRYQALLDWALDVASRAPETLRDDDPDPGLRYFANRVQPVLVRKGCMFQNCHSPTMFHDLRLRGGDQGVFSRVATRRNHDVSKEFLALEAPNVNEARLVAKNLFPASEVDGASGMFHRGGALFEDFSADGTLRPASPELCDAFDADAGDLNEVPAYCILARWHEIEREQAIARGELLPDPVESLVWVSRPLGAPEVRDFDAFVGGADLRIAPLTLDGSGAATLGVSASLLGSCGFGGDVDVRGPAVSWDGATIAFAARESEASPLRIFRVSADGAGCEPFPGAASPAAEEAGIPLHDFDPAFAPDGRLVFASTRGNVDGEGVPGPSRTPASLAPNANLYVLEDGAVRQLTFLLNQEVAPSFLADGRVIFTTEKREPEFHQLALRRLNLDGGDYHPLFAQRGSVGFEAATEVVELPNRNLAFVAGPLGAAEGAGTIVVVNRSLGPDQDDRAAGDRAYLHAMSVPVPGAFGGIPGIPGGPTTQGAFRSPAPLPSGRLVVSCDLGATDLTRGGYAYQLCELDPEGFEVRPLGGEMGRANVEAVAVMARPRLPIFTSRKDEANGATRVEPGATDAEVHFLDFPLLATLLFENTRVDRPIDARIEGVQVFAAEPPPTSATRFSDVADEVVSDGFGEVFVRYRSLGVAPLFADGSVRVRLPGGVPLLFQPTDGGGEALTFDEGALFSGAQTQREQMQFYPGERANQSFPRRFFNGSCGVCHGSVSGRELDVAAAPDVLTSATWTQARGADPFPLR
mgnify:CR=1 FL=1